MWCRFYAVSLLCFLALLTGCEASFNVSTASLSEAVLALRVDAETQAPVEKAGTITPDTQTIYATVKVSTAPADTKVKAVFFYREDTDRQIAEDTVVAQGTQYVSFSLSPPANGWPVGEYRVQFYLNDQAKNELRFSVRQETAVAQVMPAVPPQVEERPAATAGNEAYQRLTEGRFGFSFEVPVSWSWKLIPGTNDYLVSGPAATDAGEISIIVQVVDTRLGGVSSLKEQMLALVDQFAQIQGASVAKKDVIAAAGQNAPFFIVTYPAENGQGRKVEFGHTQMGIEHAPYILLVSYSAPRDIYQNNLGVFQHMVDSFTLSTPGS